MCRSVYKSFALRFLGAKRVGGIFDRRFCVLGWGCCVNLMNGVAIVDMDVVVLWWNQRGYAEAGSAGYQFFI